MNIIHPHFMLLVMISEMSMKIAISSVSPINVRRAHLEAIVL